MTHGIKNPYIHTDRNKQEGSVPPYIRMLTNKCSRNDGIRKSLFGNYPSDK